MGTKNTLLNLNDHLFEQLERLNDDDLSDAELDREIKRAKAMSTISKEIVNAGALLLAAQKTNNDYEFKGTIPRTLIGDNTNAQTKKTI